ncbi:MAG: hypothetical protein ACOCX2_12550 [Armatimonadota bacterium]
MRLTGWIAMVLLAAALTTPAAADEMQDAMARAKALSLMRQIDLQPGQAEGMIDPLERIQKIIDDYSANRESELGKLEPTLERARRRLVAGQSLSEQMRTALDSYGEEREQAQRDAHRTVNEQMRRIADLLSDEHNRSLDWTPPGSVHPEQRLEERLELQQIAMGRIQEAAQVLDEIKRLDAFNYVTGRGPIINDYVALYYRPDTAQFQQAYGMMLEYSGQVRVMSEQQWRQRALDIGTSLVEDLGLMPTMQPSWQTAAVSWSTLFEIMTSDQTLPVVRELAQ